MRRAHGANSREASKRSRARCEVFGDGVVAHDAQDPAEDIVLVVAEEGLESRSVAAAELDHDLLFE
jgi:hypothetical protein